MSQENRVKEIFSQAVEVAEAERAAFVEQACAGNEVLRGRVNALLKAYAQGEGFLASPTAGATAQAARGEGPGTKIGAYKLLQLIGQGGFGSVFMAEQERPVTRRVALKIIKPGMDSGMVAARFEAERQALALMDHPHIARVFDGGVTDAALGSRPYFVMEYVKGDPITLFADAHRLSIEDRLTLFTQVCEAVQHAHTKGVIHRDLKPSNVLVSMTDGRPFAKVIDFGIAKSLASRLTEKTLFTEHSQLIGTPEYMSPEQAEGSPDIDTRTDVYALGVLLYELLTGATPFDAARLRSAAFAEMQRIIRDEEPPMPSLRLSRDLNTLAATAASRQAEPAKLGPLVKGELDWIVMKALDKDRARRYESPNQLAEDVRRHISGEAVVAAPAGVGYRVGKFVKRNKGPVLAGSAVAAALSIGMTGTLWQWRLARAEAEHAQLAEAQILVDTIERRDPEGRDDSYLKSLNIREAVATNTRHFGSAHRETIRAEMALASLECGRDAPWIALLNEWIHRRDAAGSLPDGFDIKLQSQLAYYYFRAADMSSSVVWLHRVGAILPGVFERDGEHVKDVVSPFVPYVDRFTSGEWPDVPPNDEVQAKELSVALQQATIASLYRAVVFHSGVREGRAALDAAESSDHMAGLSDNPANDALRAYLTGRDGMPQAAGDERLQNECEQLLAKAQAKLRDPAWSGNLEAQGRCNDAERYLQRVWDSAESKLADESKKRRLAEAEVRFNRWSENSFDADQKVVLADLKQVIDTRIELLGEDNLDTIAACWTWGYLRGDLEVAQKAASDRERVMGRADGRSLQMYSKLFQRQMYPELMGDVENMRTVMHHIGAHLEEVCKSEGTRFLFSDLWGITPVPTPRGDVPRDDVPPCVVQLLAEEFRQWDGAILKEPWDVQASACIWRVLVNAERMGCGGTPGFWYSDLRLAAHTVPNNFVVMNTLALCEMRLQSYAEALAAVATSSEIRDKEGKGVHPTCLSIAAIATFKLGDAEKARASLGQLRALMSDPASAETWAKDADAKALLKEAEDLIDPPK